MIIIDDYLLLWILLNIYYYFINSCYASKSLVTISNLDLFNASVSDCFLHLVQFVFNLNALRACRVGRALMPFVGHFDSPTWGSFFMGYFLVVSMDFHEFARASPEKINYILENVSFVCVLMHVDIFWSIFDLIQSN